MSSDEAAQHIVQAIYQGEKELIMSNYGKLTVFLKRHFPWLVSWLISIFQVKIKSRTLIKE